MNRLRRLWLSTQIWALDAELSACAALGIESRMVEYWEWQRGELEVELILLECQR
jgi:hypothetical protein